MRVVALATLLIVTLSTQAGAQDGTPAAGQAKRQDIARWIQELDSNSYIVRATATDELIKAGAVVISPLVAALEDSNLEVSTRGIYILRELSLENDLAVSNAAIGALEQIAAVQVTAAARRAVETLAALDEIRQVRAIKQLRLLGAKVESSVDAIGFGPTDMYSVEIAEGWQGTIDDLRLVKWLRDIAQLSVAGAQVNDAWLKELSEVEQLSVLSIKHANISDAGVAQLASLPNLAALDIWYSPVTDQSVADLQGMKQLRVLKIYGTRISRESADRMARAMPALEVDFKQGAFLGVRCQQAPFYCEVSLVTPGAAAEKAGVQVGDIIVAYDEQVITNFDDLRNMIGKNKGGDSAVIGVARGAEQMVKRVLRRDNVKLGAEFKKHAMGLEVVKVDTEGAAFEAGLKVGEIVSHFRDLRIVDAAAFEKMYLDAPLGEPSLVTGFRNLQTVKMKVTFGEWE